MICSTINQLSAFGLTMIVAIMWNAAVIGSFGLMLLDVLPARRGTVALIGSGFAVAILCLVLIALSGACR